MNNREKIQISIIAILCVLLVVSIFTNFENVFASNSVSKKIIERQSTEQNQLTTPAIKQQTDTIIKSNQTMSLSAIFRHVENSIVQITSRISETNSNIIINGSPLERQSTRLGSGFIYDNSGRIVTNNHVVKGSKTVDVTFVDGNTYSANVVGTDPFNDIAVLQITDDFSDEQSSPLELGDSSKMEVGNQVIAIGNPFGLSGTMTTGIVSQIGRLLPNQEEGVSIPNAIQTDAAINPGNSGGPLLNMQGEVIGINTSIQSNTGEFSGIGFAVPSNTIKKIAPVLIEKGKYSHPWLGISGTSLTPDIVKKLNLTKNYKGVLVTTVVKDSPADKAGLQEATYNIDREIKSGDVITSIDSHQIRDISELILYLSENKNIRDKAILQVNRNNEIIELTAILQERPN